MACMCGDDGQLFLQELDSLLEKVQANEPANYIMQCTRGQQFSEATLLQTVTNLQHRNQQLEAELATTEFYKHVHNLYTASGDAMFDEFKKTLGQQLSSTNMLLFTGCNNFEHFNNIIVDLAENQQLYHVVLGAASTFLAKYKVSDRFWASAPYVRQMNTLRNTVYIDIGCSAEFIVSKLTAHPELAGDGSPMLLALAKYTSQNKTAIEQRHKALLAELQLAKGALTKMQQQ